MKYLKKFPSHEGYSAYSASTVYLTPNVSLCDQEDEVHYGSNSEPPTPPVVHVDSVSVSPTSVALNVGATTALTATVLPSDATDKSVTWSSSDETIATVNASGVITAIAVGNATITVTTVDGGKTAQCAATIEAQPQPTNFIAYTATSQLNADLTAFTPAAISETYDSTTHTGVIGFNAPVTAIGDRAFVSKDALTSIVIPDSVTSIGPVAFAGCSGMTSCTIGSGVTSIGDSAFGDCRRLESAIIPNGVTSIGNFVFGNCFSLTSVTIPDSVTTIGPSAFGSCRNLTSISLPNSITEIGNMAFYECSSLTSINIPTGITSINNYVFQNCTSLLSVDIPSGVTSIGHSALNGCTSLTSITVNRTTPPTLGDYVFDNTNNCPIYVPCESLEAYESAWSAYADRIQCPPQPVTATITYTAANKLNVALSAFTPAAISEDYDSATQTGVIGFTEPVTEIGVNAFGVKYDLMSIELPNSVTTIGNGAFGGCTGLTSATIGNGVTSIGQSAFMNCPSLTSIDIPSGVTSIGNWAFSDCTGFTSITCEAATPPTLGNNAFANTNDCPIYVPCENVNDYKSAWSTYAGRIQCDSPTPVGNSIIYRATEKLNVDLTAFTPAATAETYDSATQTGVIEFNAPVTEIGYEAFAYYDVLKSIEIPNTVTSIGEYAFDLCTSLENVEIPSSVKNIGGSAFYACHAFTEITILNGVSYGRAVYCSCYSVTTGVTIQDGVTTITESMFDTCSYLKRITIPSSVTNIEERAFYYCDELQSITINATTPPSLGPEVFEYTNCPIYVPSGSVEEYKDAEGWSDYADRIQPKP